VTGNIGSPTAAQMTDTEHGRLRQARADVWRYARAEAGEILPPPVICCAAADWISRNGSTYAYLVVICRRQAANPQQEG